MLPNLAIDSDLIDICLNENLQDYNFKYSLQTPTLEDIMMSYVGECSVLVLLDHSAGFDTVGHSIFIERLRQWVGVSGTALDWFSSCLSDSFSVTWSLHV